MRFAIGALTIVLSACGAGPSPRHPMPPVSLKDAPFETADRGDLEVIRDQYRATRPDSKPRRELREKLLSEYVHRMGRALDQRDEADAFHSLSELGTLWNAQEIARDAAAELAPHTETLRRMRKVFARSGGDREVVLLLSFLIVADPSRGKTYESELDDVFRYADELAVAEYGDGAERSRSVEILSAALVSFPSPSVINRLTTLLIARQKALDSRFRERGADLQTIRAHGRGVLHAAWDVAAAHVRLHDFAKAEAAVAGIVGIGDNPELLGLLRAVRKSKASVTDWVRLANAFRQLDGETADLEAALAVCAAAIERFPRDAAAYTCAGHAAFEGRYMRQAIDMFESSLAIDPSRERAAERLSQLYQTIVSELALADRLQEAQAWLKRTEAFHHARARQKLAPLTPGLAEAYAALARGMLSLGDVKQANDYLVRSIREKPTRSALELYGTVELKLGHYDSAVLHLQRAFEMPVRGTENSFDQNRILRLMGEAHQGRGDEERAQEVFRTAIIAWAELAKKTPLAKSGVAEAEVERGKLFWHLSRKDLALQAFERAVDADPDGASTHTEAVAFLVSRGEYEPALDTYHRALGSRTIRDYYKVYMSLWMLAESRRRGDKPDPLVTDYLASRDGRLWYDELARFAVGRADLAPLAARAETRGKKAEIYYYSAVLGESHPKEQRTLLRKVVDTDTVLYFEYDMAKRRLELGPLAPEARR